ncbi:MAG TPA: histidine kinase [Vicinamibacterales bacterium]|nr:histidine kinase [Vicinamibacterales bacterium]
MICSLKFWARMAAINAAAALTVGFAFNGLTLHTPWRKALELMSISFLFSSIISSMSAITISAIAPTLFRRTRFPFNWSILIAVLIGIATIGSLLALFVLSAIGYLNSRAIFVEWFAGSLKISVIVTLIFGIFGTLMELMQGRLNDATVALRTTERDQAEARRIAAEAQLASIESRVQPHFLFNTLNSIAALVHDDPGGAERMTGQLASLLRSALDSTATPLVPLDDELRVVRAYLDIERVRFGDRLRYDVELGDGTGRAIVPRMALQTLVENSVKYAISPRREGGSIVVRAIAADGRVRVTVEDDGPGFDAAQRPEGHGLSLLDARLAMLFADAATIHIDSRPGRSAVTLDVPVGRVLLDPPGMPGPKGPGLP